MKTEGCKAILNEMDYSQRSAIEKLSEIHSDLKWDGGSIKEKRISIWKNEKSVAAINKSTKKFRKNLGSELDI